MRRQSSGVVCPAWTEGLGGGRAAAARYHPPALRGDRPQGRISTMKRS